MLEPYEWWLVLGVVASFLPAYLLYKTITHVLNINLRQRWR